MSVTFTETSSGGHPQRQTDDFAGTVNGKAFHVQICPLDAPFWYDDEDLDDDDKNEVLAAIDGDDDEPRVWEEDYDFSDVSDAMSDIASEWWDEQDDDVPLRDENADEFINIELDSAGLRCRTTGGWWFADPVAQEDDYRDAIHAGLDAWLASRDQDDDE